MNSKEQAVKRQKMTQPILEYINTLIDLTELELLQLMQKRRSAILQNTQKPRKHTTGESDE